MRGFSSVGGGVRRARSCGATRARSVPGLGLRVLLLALVVPALTGCMQSAQLDSARAQAAQSVQRYDNFQAAAANGRVLVAAGSAGVLVVSADGGAQWSRQVLAEPSAIIALSTCPDGRFAALDFHRKVWIGDAQGQDWQPRALGSDINPLALACDPAGKLWVVGSFSTILSSADEGKSWTSTDLGADAILTTVQFLDAQNGVVSGEFGTLLKTRNGGQSWEKQAGLPETFYPYSTLFLDASRGYTTGVAGVLLATRDGGRSWTALDNPAGAPMYALARHGDTLIAAGAGGQLLEREGDGWSSVRGTPRVPAHFAALAPIDDSTLLAVGGGGALAVVKLGTPAAAPAGEAS